MTSGHYLIEKRTLSGFGDDDGRRRRRKRFSRVLVVDVAPSPGAYGLRGELGVLSSRQQVVGTVDGHKALRVTRRLEQAGCVIDSHDVVDGGVKDKQRPSEGRNSLLDGVAGEALDERPSDGEGTPADVDHALPRSLDLVGSAGEQPEDMGDISRRSNSCDGPHFGYVGGDGDNGGTSQAVPDKQLRGMVVLAQPVGSVDEVVEIAREIGLGEVACTGAESGEVEAEDSEAGAVQLCSNTACSEEVLRTGEAMSKQRIGQRRAGG